MIDTTLYAYYHINQKDTVNIFLFLKQLIKLMRYNS